MGRGFIARAGVQARSSHLMKKAQATAAVGVQGLRVGIRLQGVSPRKFSQPPELCLWHFSGACLNMPNLSDVMYLLVPKCLAFYMLLNNMSIIGNVSILGKISDLIMV